MADEVANVDPKESKTTLRKIFITGLLILIPIAATVIILVFLFNLFDGWLSPAGGRILRAFGLNLPLDLQHIPGFGIVATVVLIFLVGLFGSNYLGRQVLQFGDRLIKRVPLVNSIYIAIRQVVSSFSITGANAFKTVVLFEYPRKGLWAIGFITSPSLASAEKITKQKLMNVFLPTTPNPTSGFLLLVPEKDLHVLPISAENGLKIIATVGLIQTEAQARTLVAEGNPLAGRSSKPARKKIKKS